LTPLCLKQFQRGSVLPATTSAAAHADELAVIEVGSIPAFAMLGIDRNVTDVTGSDVVLPLAVDDDERQACPGAGPKDPSMGQQIDDRIGKRSGGHR